MARLALTEDMRRRGLFKSIADLQLTLAAYLDAATEHVAEMLRVVTFDRVEDNADIFYLDSQEEPFITGHQTLRVQGARGGGRLDRQSPGPFGFVKLYLRNGFVDKDATNFPIVIERGFNLDDFLGNPQAVNVNLFEVNHEKGLITITDDEALVKLFSEPFIDREFLKVKYASGFKQRNVASPDVRVYRDVPLWLREAAILFALKLFGQQGKCSTEDRLRCMAMSQRLPAFLDSHIRFVPNAIKPMNYPR